MNTTALDLINEFRDRIGDTSQSVPASNIISNVNTAMRRIARSPGLARLFDFRDTYELDAINEDGTLSAAWDLGKIGQIIDIPRLQVLLATESGPKPIPLAYKEYDDFFEECGFPEYQQPGRPNYYTIEQIGSNNRLLFNRPPKDLIAIDIKYQAYHPRLVTPNDEVLLAWSYLDIIVEYVIILHKIETTDQATARALYEDLDVLTTDLRELLAKRKGTLNYRRIKRSF